MTIQEQAADRVLGCYESDDDDGVEFDFMVLITIILTLLQNCPKPASRLRANARNGGIFVRAMVAQTIHQNAPHIKGKKKRAMVDALLAAAVNSTNEEIEQVQAAA
jgi:hypothetical protein